MRTNLNYSRKRYFLINTEIPKTTPITSDTQPPTLASKAIAKKYPATELTMANRLPKRNIPGSRFENNAAVAGGPTKKAITSTAPTDSKAITVLNDTMAINK